MTSKVERRRKQADKAKARGGKDPWWYAMMVKLGVALPYCSHPECRQLKLDGLTGPRGAQKVHTWTTSKTRTTQPVRDVKLNRGMAAELRGPVTYVDKAPTTQTTVKKHKCTYCAKHCTMRHS
ncbi:unnamed protein product [Pedinophyceae sp. YPF-701]|nr:unnamed protein product [Pedinophyceae sp. YPF-701]